MNFDFPEEEFVSAAETPLRVRIAPAESLSKDGQLVVERVDAQTAVMQVPGFGQFSYCGADDILTVRALEFLDAKSIQTAILNQGLPFALAVQGELIVHASAVEFHNRAVLFMGRRGVGKSHFAAHSVAGGQEMLADDFVRLVPGDQVMAIPSFPEIRIFEDEAARFSALAATSGVSGPKSCLKIENRFCTRPLSVRAIYHIVRNGDVSGGPNELCAMEKFRAIMDNCLFYPTLRPQDVERRLNLLQRIATSAEITFQHFNLGETFAKDLNQMRACFNL